MKSSRGTWTNGYVITVLFLALLALGATGCRSLGLPGLGPRKSGFEVVPLSNQEIAALTADDVVRIMRRAGFSDQQILELGTDLRNGLLLSGAVQIKKQKVEAIFAIRGGDYVYITTRLRGSFIYDLKAGQFGVSSSSSPAEL